MLQAVLAKESNEIIIRGDFFELDQIYFLIERINGRCGIDRPCLLPEYQTALSMLLALNYEIRHAQQGDRELYSIYNGIRENWIAPAGTPANRIVKREDLHEPEELISQVEDAVLIETDIDPIDFQFLDADEQEEILFDLRFEDDEIKEYIQWAHKKPTYYFAHEECPEHSRNNILLQFRIPAAEGILYAVILREIFKNKDLLLENMMTAAESVDEGMRNYEKDYCLLRARPELCLLEQLMEEIFSCVAHLLGPDLYIKIQKKEVPKDFLKKLDEKAVRRTEELLSKYSGKVASGAEQFMNELFDQRIYCS